MPEPSAILQALIALTAGILAGTFTGLIPGIHINLLAVFLISLSSALLQYLNPITLVIFIASMSITHTFIDFIPSIFLGAPDEDSYLSILPGHELLKKGLAQEASVLTLYGSLTALAIILLFTPVFIFILPKIFIAIQEIIPFLLIFTSLYLILRENEFLISITVFLLAGFLGLLTFTLPVKEPLLPLLTGLFGSSALMVSLKTSSPNLAKQEIKPLKKIKLPKKQILKSSISASLTAPLSSFLPGLGAGQAAVIASEFTELNHKSFLFLVGSINTIVLSLSFITLYSIDRTRSGSAVAVKEILQTVTPKDLTAIIITILISGIMAFIIGIHITKFSARHIHKINYKTLSIFTLLFLLIINILFTNLMGILVLATAASLGIFTILSNSRRINLMGSLLIPTILYYLLN